jgi:hypothetical protein
LGKGERKARKRNIQKRRIKCNKKFSPFQERQSVGNLLSRCEFSPKKIHSGNGSFVYGVYKIPCPLVFFLPWDVFVLGSRSQCEFLEEAQREWLLSGFPFIKVVVALVLTLLWLNATLRKAEKVLKNILGI